jgi:hypothetical protein
MTGPVFVVGASRSGTNLVRALLNRHHTLWVSAETHYFDDLRPRLPGAGTQRLEGEARDRCEEYFLALEHRPFGQDGDAASSKLDRDDLRFLADQLGGTGDAYFEALCRLRARRHARDSWGEKTPRHAYRIDDLLAAFPDAKVVCLVRDPRAVVASYRDWHAAAALRGETESEQLQADRERSRRSFNLVLMTLLWRGVVRASYAALRQHGPERVRIQPYERLADAPEAEVRDLCAWLGLEFEQTMMEIAVVNSSYRTTGLGIATEPVDRWKQRLSRHEIGIVQSVASPLLEEAGYEREPVPTPALRLTWAFATVPFAAGRAAVQNRARLGRVSQYARTRVGSAFGRGPLGADDGL